MCFHLRGGAHKEQKSREAQALRARARSQALRARARRFSWSLRLGVALCAKSRPPPERRSGRPGSGEAARVHGSASARAVLEGENGRNRESRHTAHPWRSRRPHTSGVPPPRAQRERVQLWRASSAAPCRAAVRAAVQRLVARAAGEARAQAQCPGDQHLVGPGGRARVDGRRAALRQGHARARQVPAQRGRRARVLSGLPRWKAGEQSGRLPPACARPAPRSPARSDAPRVASRRASSTPRTTRRKTQTR